MVKNQVLGQNYMFLVQKTIQTNFNQGKLF